MANGSDNWMVKAETKDGELYVVDYENNVTGPSLLRRLKIKFVTVKSLFKFELENSHGYPQLRVKHTLEKLTWIKSAEANLPPDDPDAAVY